MPAIAVPERQAVAAFQGAGPERPQEEADRLER
jgi:hypothetical protein